MNPIALATIISTISSTPSQKPLAARPKSASACSDRDARERRDLGERDEAGKGALVRRIVHRRAELGGSGMRVFGHEFPETVA